MMRISPVELTLAGITPAERSEVDYPAQTTITLEQLRGPIGPLFFVAEFTCHCGITTRSCKRQNHSEMMSSMSLLKSVGKVGGYTFLSRLLGFLRDQLIAFTFGAGDIAEAFLVAQRFPNLFRALFAEGAFNNIFVPMFARKCELEGQSQAFSFSRDALSIMATWMLIFCGICMSLMPWIMPIFAQGFSNDPQKQALTTELTRICLPYLGLVSLSTLFGGILNSMGRFSAAAAAPILLNIFMIAFNLFGWWQGLGNSPESARLQAWAVSTAGLAQLALVMFAAANAGAPVWPGIPRLTPDVRQLIRRSVPGIISGGVIQINLAIATNIASSFKGGVSSLYYADRLFQLPLGVIGVTIGVILLPALSRKLRVGDHSAALAIKNRALELAMLLTLPATIALMIIGRPILHVIYEHGAFSRADTLSVVPALIAFAVGLPAFTLTKIFQPSFFAREDTRTPTYFAIVAVVVNISASLLLSRYLGYVGIALAFSISAWLNAALLVFTSIARQYYQTDGRFRQRLSRILVSVAAMGIVLVSLLHIIEGSFAPGTNFATHLWSLLVLLSAGTVTYAMAAQFTGAFTLQDIKDSLK